MRKKLTSDELDYSYLIYPPAGAHKVFRIMKLYKASRKSETIKTPELETVNKSLVHKQISADEARMQVEFIRAELYLRDGVELNDSSLSLENKKVLDDYWVKVYAGRELEDVNAAKYDLSRALSSLGKLDIAVASKDELQRRLDRHFKGNKHRRIVLKLNSVLKFLGRDFRLKPAAKELGPLKYITIEDLPVLLECLPYDEVKLIHEVCFYTGVSSGEAMTLDQRSYDLSQDSVRVFKHLSTSGAKVESNKSRTTVVIPEGRDSLLAWFRIRNKFPIHLKKRISIFTRRAAVLAFPDKPLKHITFNDLRHSYAIHLLRQGVPLSLVADCLGIEQKYAKETYGQFDLSGDSLSLISRTLRARRGA